MGTSAASSMHDCKEQNASILRVLQEWCARETRAIDARSIDPDKPFNCHNPEWAKRFALRDALLPWVREYTGLETFYPDELDVCSTPRTLARHLETRLALGREPEVRPPVIPFRRDPVREPTVFILSCARSGSTLLRCMLMGHPMIYAPPEFHLAQFRSLRARERLFTENG